MNLFKNIFVIFSLLVAISSNSVTAGADEDVDYAAKFNKFMSSMFEKIGSMPEGISSAIDGFVAAKRAREKARRELEELRDDIKILVDGRL